MDEKKIILASGSPRRIELFNRLGYHFRSCVADIDETPDVGETPVAYVLRLAEEKALAVGACVGAAEIIVSADTIVVDGETLLGKPVSEADAGVMLKALRGRSHQVYTAIAVLRKVDGTLVKDHCVSHVPMRDYSDNEIDAYIRSGDPMDKAGAYAIQNQSFHPVEHFEDCFACVVGLPMCHLVHLLSLVGMRTDTTIPELCGEQFNYMCTIYHQMTYNEQVIQTC